MLTFVPSGGLSAEVLPSLHRRNQSNTCVRPIASSPCACCNNWYVPVAVFPILNQNLIQMRYSVLSHIVKNRCDTNARFTSATYYSQLRKRSHLQLVSWVAKTCTNMSRLVANTSHPVNNHYNSNPDTIWKNLVYCLNSVFTWHLMSLEEQDGGGDNIKMTVGEKCKAVNWPALQFMWVRLGCRSHVFVPSDFVACQVHLEKSLQLWSHFLCNFLGLLHPLKWRHYDFS